MYIRVSRDYISHVDVMWQRHTVQSFEHKDPAKNGKGFFCIFRCHTSNKTLNPLIPRFQNSFFFSFFFFFFLMCFECWGPIVPKLRVNFRGNGQLPLCVRRKFTRPVLLHPWNNQGNFRASATNSNQYQFHPWDNQGILQVSAANETNFNEFESKPNKLNTDSAWRSRACGVRSQVGGGFPNWGIPCHDDHDHDMCMIPQGRSGCKPLSSLKPMHENTGVQQRKRQLWLGCHFLFCHVVFSRIHTHVDSCHFLLIVFTRIAFHFLYIHPNDIWVPLLVTFQRSW